MAELEPENSVVEVTVDGRLVLSHAWRHDRHTGAVFALCERVCYRRSVFLCLLDSLGQRNEKQAGRPA